MPCNSDHMEPNRMERGLSQVAAILDELETGELNKDHFRGFHPTIYCKSIDKQTADKLVSDLCGRLQNYDATRLSLEAQMWWRDHQEADAARLRKEAEKHTTDAQRQRALDKLTPYERELLGL